MLDGMENPLSSPEAKKKFDIKVGLFNDVNICEIRGEPTTGKTKLMLEAFLYDFLTGFAEQKFNSYIVTPNQRISDYFLTSIRNILFQYYKENKEALEKVDKILNSRVITLAVISRGDMIRFLNVENVYVDPADFMSILDILNLVHSLKPCKSLKNIYFFRNS